jgi:hypothetical protein
MIRRFIPIVQRLGKLYGVPPTSLHVFYDLSGSTVAFNANGSLFCNARYYEGWREFMSICIYRGLIFAIDDADILRGSRSNAYISWSVCFFAPLSMTELSKFRFFTLAHEIAHNLVQPHNSEHEFYFSAICEQHVVSLARLLAEVGT